MRRLGSTRSEAVDVAIIAATSEDLAAAVERGRFRADLYHRLAVVTLVLPPLRARGRDVLLLAEHFLGARRARTTGSPPASLTDDAQAALLAHAWPGNVRELANVLERAALLSDEPTLTAAGAGAAGAVGADAARDAPVPASAGDRDARPRASAAMLLDVLDRPGWNFTHAAARLGAAPQHAALPRRAAGACAGGPARARRRGGRPSGAAGTLAGADADARGGRARRGA